jgi:hypothetical protein
MSPVLDQNAVISTEELRSIAECAGPCITVYLPTTHTGVDRIRVKSAVQQAQTLLAGRNMEAGDVERLLEPIRQFPGDAGNGSGKTVVILRSAELFRTISLPWSVDEAVSVGSHFQILPLLPLLQKQKPFYILALSQKHIRLLRCTAESSAEVELPESVPQSITADIDEIDLSVDQHSVSGPSTGKMKGVKFGSGSGEERQEERLTHFYQAVDKALNAFLKDDSTPLVLAGVDYELALYHRISKHPHLIEGGVHGAPDGLKGGELHKRALEIVGNLNDQVVEDALKQYEKQGGTDKTSTDAANILKAAREGRVAHLLIAKESGSTDCHNAALIQTLLHSGQVNLVPSDRMPGGSTMAALLRY